MISMYTVAGFDSKSCSTNVWSVIMTRTLPFTIRLPVTTNIEATVFRYTPEIVLAGFKKIRE